MTVVILPLVTSRVSKPSAAILAMGRGLPPVGALPFSGERNRRTVARMRPAKTRPAIRVLRFIVYLKN